MAEIHRCQVVWTGFPGGPGYTSFYGRGLAAGVSAILGFFVNIRNLLPADVTITVPQTGDVFEETTGELTNQWTGTGGGSTTGLNTGGYAAPVGAVVNWKTNGINRGHKVRGRTFLVPLGSDQYTTAGSLVALSQAKILDESNAMMNTLAGDLVIWSRPRLGVGGAAFPVVANSVPSIAAVLRSRRD